MELSVFTLPPWRAQDLPNLEYRIASPQSGTQR
jgi:hypothetical protein